MNIVQSDPHHNIRLTQYILLERLGFRLGKFIKRPSIFKIRTHELNLER